MKKKMRRLIIIISLLCIMLPSFAFAEENASFLFEETEQFVEPNIEEGPWIYESQTLSIFIRKSMEGGSMHFVADIYLRGEVPYGGFAYQTPPGMKTELPHTIARRYTSVFGITGDYLCHYNNPKGVMIREGKVYYDEKNADVLAIFPNGEMEVYPKGTISAQELLEEGVQDSLAFGPIILKDGEEQEATTTHPLKPKNVRTGIGKVEDGHYVAVVSIGTFTFSEFAALFKTYGCTWAYNLDGGHSAAMVLMGEQINPHSLETIYSDVTVRQRPIPDVFLIGRSALTPGVDDPARYRGSR